MREIRIRKRTNHHTKEEAITNNLKTMETLEKAALNAVNGAIDVLRNSKTLRDDIRTGKKEITIIDDGGPLIVKDDYYTYICNERKGIKYPHKYEHLISDSTFNAVQKLNGARSHQKLQTERKNGEDPYTYNGLRCAICGGAMSSYVKKGHTYLRCSGSEAS